MGPTVLYPSGGQIFGAARRYGLEDWAPDLRPEADVRRRGSDDNADVSGGCFAYGGGPEALMLRLLRATGQVAGRYLMWMPLIARLITSRCTSLVPSKIV